MLKINNNFRIKTQMKIISIIHNNITGKDLAVYFKDNYSDDIDQPPSPPRNTTHVTHTKSGPVLQIEFWRNERFQKYFWLGEKVWFEAEDHTDFVKRGSQWLEFLEIYNSF
jgi:hypothetical protein